MASKYVSGRITCDLLRHTYRFRIELWNKCLSSALRNSRQFWSSSDYTSIINFTARWINSVFEFTLFSWLRLNTSRRISKYVTSSACDFQISGVTYHDLKALTLNLSHPYLFWFESIIITSLLVQHQHQHQHLTPHVREDARTFVRLYVPSFRTHHLWEPSLFASCFSRWRKALSMM